MSPRVKICGLTRTADIEVAVAAGADAIGFVLAASPRRVGARVLGRLLAAVPPGVLRVAVTRVPTRAELELVASLPFDALQSDAEAGPVAVAEPFHLPVYYDRPGVLRALPGRAPSGPVASFASAVLLDSGRGGGSGERASIMRAQVAARRRPLVLAGGLDPDNVASAIAFVQPFAVDVSSGVESAPGRKDPGAVRAFLAAVRSNCPSTSR